jgi:hypothetical protein
MDSPSPFWNYITTAEAYLIYGGARTYQEGKIKVLPASDCIKNLGELLA